MLRACWSAPAPPAHPRLWPVTSAGLPATSRLPHTDQSGIFKTALWMGLLGGSVGEASDFGPGHDLPVRGFEPRVGLRADGSEPGACFASSWVRAPRWAPC